MISEAIRLFFKTTTLHGFKYLTSSYRFDRVVWILGCCASACCAGVLCAVLWARFLQVPVLLVLQPSNDFEEPMPLVAVCLPPDRTANTFLKYLNADTNLTSALSRVLQGKQIDKERLGLLDKIIKDNNAIMPDIMFDATPPCHSILKKCRWQNKMTPCGRLFHKQITEGGICCVMKPSAWRLNKKHVNYPTHKLNLALQCFDGSVRYECQFYVNYDGENLINTSPLAPGLEYIAKSSFTLVKNSDTDKLTREHCISNENYSRKSCLVHCIENICNCSNPMRLVSDKEENVLPFCSMSKMHCLRRTGLGDIVTCNCLPSCRKITSDMSLESTPLNMIPYTIDPLYQYFNVTSSTVLTIYVIESRIFRRKSTETWFTLLSSMGGVFNMFLGVGLFSILELLFLLIVKIPIAFRKSLEIKQSRVTFYD